VTAASLALTGVLQRPYRQRTTWPKTAGCLRRHGIQNLGPDRCPRAGGTVPSRSFLAGDCRAGRPGWCGSADWVHAVAVGGAVVSARVEHADAGRNAGRGHDGGASSGDAGAMAHVRRGHAVRRHL